MSFAKQETAARARDLIQKAARGVAKEETPRKLIGRMMSVDLPRLRGTVWFPGDSQPITVNIFANAVPADWQYKEDGRDGQDSSIAGYGSEVVVERLNGQLWVTQVLTGGTAALDFKPLNMSVMGMKGAPTQAGGPSADAIVDISWRPYETFVNMRIDADTVLVGGAVEFGPFTTWIETTPFGGSLEMTVQLGDSFRMYRMAVNIAEDFDIDSVNYPQPLWARMLPEHDNGSRWYPSDFRGYGSEYALDVCLRRTAYGNTENFTGYREMWFRIVKLNEWKNVPGINAAITLRSNCVQRARSLGGRELFMYEVVNKPAFPVGYVGFHESGMGPTKQLSNFSDNFNRVVSGTGNWGQGESVNNTNWVAAGTATAAGVDGFSAYMDIAANNVNYEMSNGANINGQPDFNIRFQCPVVATGAPIRIAFIHAQDPSNPGNRNLFGLDLGLAGALSVTARRSVGGVVSNMTAPVAASFSYGANMWLRFRIRLMNNNANSQTIWLKVWMDGTKEPHNWDLHYVYSPGSAVYYNGYYGFLVRAETGNTNAKNITIKFGEMEGNNNPENWAGHGEYWSTGPWRNSPLRIAQDLQKTFTYTGTFKWDGTYLKLPTRINLTGVGRKHDGLAQGRAEIFMNPDSSDEIILRYPHRSSEGPLDPYITVTYSQGIPLAEGQSLWCGIEPGAGIDNQFRYLFILDSAKDWQSGVPEWAILIAARGFSDAVPEIRLGNGEVLDRWRAFSYAAGWSDYAGGFDTGAYRMEAGGIVRLKGLVKNTNINATTTITTLPVGFRPQLGKIFMGVSSASGFGEFSRIGIDTTGTITPTNHFSGGGAGFISLEGITFNINS